MTSIIKSIEGDYCCLHGYLRLCRARGETPETMAKNLNCSERGIRHHYTIINKCGWVPKTHRCQNRMDCMLPIVEELDAEKGP